MGCFFFHGFLPLTIVSIIVHHFCDRWMANAISNLLLFKRRENEFRRARLTFNYSWGFLTIFMNCPLSGPLDIVIALRLHCWASEYSWLTWRPQTEQSQWIEHCFNDISTAASLIFVNGCQKTWILIFEMSNSEERERKKSLNKNFKIAILKSWLKLRF